MDPAGQPRFLPSFYNISGDIATAWRKFQSKQIVNKPGEQGRVDSAAPFSRLFAVLLEKPPVGASSVKKMPQFGDLGIKIFLILL